MTGDSHARFSCGVNDENFYVVLVVVGVLLCCFKSVICCLWIRGESIPMFRLVDSFFF